MVVGNVGAPSFMSYTIIGDPVNVAARLMQRAAPNEILIGPHAALSLRAAAAGGASLLDRRTVEAEGQGRAVEVVSLRVAPATRRRPQRARGTVKVLIIDDDEDLRNILAHYLKQEWPDCRSSSSIRSSARCRTHRSRSAPTT